MGGIMVTTKIERAEVSFDWELNDFYIIDRNNGFCLFDPRDDRPIYVPCFLKRRF